MEASAIAPVTSCLEIERYHELGLGRGVNVTDPEMWKNKSSFLVRKVHSDLDNIIGTQECGMLERYRREVSTFSMHQQSLRLSLDDPTKHVKIGMDEHFSQSTSSTKIIEGKKVETRTVAFRFDFDDVPLYNSVDKSSIEAPTDFLPDDDNSFENGLSKWILKRIKDRLDKEEYNDVLDSTKKPVLKGILENGEKPSVMNLADVLKELGDIKAIQRSVRQDCIDFVNNLGITHYVSAIKLGACRYHVVTSNSKQTKLGAETEVEAGSVAKGGVSGFVAKKWLLLTEEEQEIGRLKDKTVEEEAVIGFQIQPIYKLVRVQFIQMALRKAIKEYIQSKEDKSEGPFLISCQINHKPVYWTVNEEDGYKIMGTETVGKAALFYVIPTEDPAHPSEFFIAYWGKEEGDKQRVIHIKDIYRKVQKEMHSLPHYLSTESNVFGYCSGPLTLKPTVEIKQARFCLHSRVQHSFACMMCLSTPVSLGDWIEGEQFYINCSHRFLKIDGYIAMEKENARPVKQPTRLEKVQATDKPEEEEQDHQAVEEADKPKGGEQEHQADETVKQKKCQEDARYRTVTLPTIRDPSKSEELGMLFRLHPLAHKEKSSNTTSNPTTQAAQTTPDQGITQSEGPLTNAATQRMPPPR